MRIANRKGNSEELEQRRLMAIVGFFEEKHPELQWLFHIPNGGWRHVATAQALKRLGVKPGVPDLFLPIPRHGLHGLWIEMKSKSGRVSANQVLWINHLTEQGYATSVCFSAEEAIRTIWAYLGYDFAEIERSVKLYDREIQKP